MPPTKYYQIEKVQFLLKVYVVVDWVKEKSNYPKNRRTEFGKKPCSFSNCVEDPQSQ